MASSSFTQRSSAQVIDSTSEGGVSASLNIKAALQRFDEVDETINSIESVDRAQVEKTAEEIDKNTTREGLLKGLPIAVKANIDVRGYPTTAGTPRLKSFHPKQNAPIIEAMIEQGAVMFGKANMHELAFGATSNNSYSGAVHNPYAPERVPGGSSGGSGAAVAAGIVPIAIGTDTGGSVRVPSALCGIAGFRPTTGRWPRSGILPISHTRDTAGPMARTVAELDLVDRAVTDPERPPAQAADLSGRRFGVPRNFYWETLTKDVRQNSEAALEALAAAGVELVEVDLGEIAREAETQGMTIAISEATPDITEYLAASGAEISLDDVLDQVASPDVAEIATVMRSLDDEAMQAYRSIVTENRPRWQAAYAKVFADLKLDALVFPMVCCTAPPIGDDVTMDVNGEQVPTFLTLVRNSAPGSVIGLPGVTVPNGVGSDGLPIGLGLDGPAGNDTQLLEIGLAVEALLTA